MKQLSGKIKAVMMRQGSFVHLDGHLWTTSTTKSMSLNGNYSNKELEKYFRICDPKAELFEKLKKLEEKIELDYAS
tara:strand:- start:72 stop:299 length:228 start_codon:yes stop_codon:yes gene_type:complete